VAQVQDYMPVGVGDTLAYADGWLVRELEVVRGKMYFEVGTCSCTFCNNLHELVLYHIYSLSTISAIIVSR
jgi:hypothetical protein